ncbi:TetR/AcrR family transcriptional regulator [Enterococcus sp. LJL98]
MPKETFLNLSSERQARIDDILLNVFFEQHLSQVNVSEIVKQMAMSRGAFYKYFEDLTDAHTYIVKKYSAMIHRDIFDFVQQADSNFFLGIRQYFVWCTQLDRQSTDWKGLVLLTRTNHQRTMKRSREKKSSVQAKQWLALLEKNNYQTHSNEEADHLFFFLIEMVVDSLTNWIINDWTTEEFLTDFDYRVKWLTQGILHKKKEDDVQ